LNPIGRAVPWTVKRLAWRDEDLGTLAFPAGEMKLRTSFGSGLARRTSDPPGVIWGVGDRGPNIKPKTLVELYGVERMRPLLRKTGAKVMPRLDLGPQIAKLRVAGERVELVEVLRLRDEEGSPVSGLPIPGGEHARREPALDLDGRELEPDPSGFDTEGIAAAADGGFWIGDEFGPSLVRMGGEGRILVRIVPEGVSLPGARYPVRASLPPIAARRHLNRGFEALALSDDERWLFLGFQSPLAHPDVGAHKNGRHVRVWRLDASTLEVAAQYLYPLDPPESFGRDMAIGPLDRSDIKVSELACICEDGLLVLERATHSSKIYKVRLDEGKALPAAHLDLAARPTVEELSARGALGDFELGKQLVFDSDQAEEVPPDLEGMAILSPTELLLVNDNDFGVEGADTQFWKVVFSQPMLA
jgi:phytase-like protein